MSQRMGTVCPGRGNTEPRPEGSGGSEEAGVAGGAEGSLGVMRWVWRRSNVPSHVSWNGSAWRPRPLYARGGSQVHSRTSAAGGGSPPREAGPPQAVPEGPAAASCCRAPWELPRHTLRCLPLEPGENILKSFPRFLLMAEFPICPHHKNCHLTSGQTPAAPPVGTCLGLSADAVRPERARMLSVMSPREHGQVQEARCPCARLCPEPLRHLQERGNAGEGKCGGVCSL